MDAGAVYALLTAVGFKINTLTVRALQEKGTAAIETYTIYRYALIPAIIWSLIFIRKDDLSLIFHSPKLLVIFGIIVVLWNLQAYLRALITNSTNSMVLFSTIFNILVFPLFVIVGVFLNHDKLNILSLSAVVILLLALLIKPTPHKENLRPRLSKPLPLLVLLIFITACCDAVLQGTAREALKQLDPTVLLGAFSVPTLAVCWIISKFHIHKRTPATPTSTRNKWLAIVLIPMTWFLASIPESFSLAAIPIYVFISINVVTFLMDTASDIFNKRLHFNLQTASFIVVVLVGISLSVLSIN